MPSNNEILKLLVMLKQQQTAASQGANQNQVSQHPPANAHFLLGQLRILQANDNASQAILSTSRGNCNSALPVNSTDLSQALHGQPTNNATSQQHQLLALLHNTLSSVNAKLATEIAGRAQQQNVLPQSAQVC